MERIPRTDDVTLERRGFTGGECAACVPRLTGRESVPARRANSQACKTGSPFPRIAFWMP